MKFSIQKVILPIITKPYKKEPIVIDERNRIIYVVILPKKHITTYYTKHLNSTFIELLSLKFIEIENEFINNIVELYRPFYNDFMDDKIDIEDYKKYRLTLIMKIYDYLNNVEKI